MSDAVSERQGKDQLAVPVLIRRASIGTKFLVEAPFRLYRPGTDDGFTTALEDAPVAVVVVAKGDENVEAWYELASRHPATSFLLIGSLEPVSARAIVRAHPDDVFWWPGSRATLLSYLDRLLAPDPVRVLSRVLAVADSARLELGTRITLSLLADLRQPPIPTVRGIARVAGLAESTLRGHLCRDFGTYTPKKVVDGLVWLRAAAVVDNTNSRTKIRLGAARSVGVDPSTLDSISRRLHGYRFLVSVSRSQISMSLFRFQKFWRGALDATLNWELINRRC